MNFRQFTADLIDNGTWQLIRMNPSHMEILQLLELIPKPEEPAKKKRGRPAGNKNKEKAIIQDGTDQTPKRRRGRPLGSKNKPKVIDPKTSESDGTRFERAKKKLK